MIRRQKIAKLINRPVQPFLIGAQHFRGGNRRTCSKAGSKILSRERLDGNLVAAHRFLSLVDQTQQVCVAALHHVGDGCLAKLLHFPAGEAFGAPDQPLACPWRSCSRGG